MAQQDHIGTTATTVKTGEDGKTRVTYHSTDVVTFDADEIVLNHGGYMTATTKTRMNQASKRFSLGFRVFQEDFDWFVEYQNTVKPFGNMGEEPSPHAQCQGEEHHVLRRQRQRLTQIYMGSRRA